MNTHTPGPWKAIARKEGWAIKAKSGCVLAVVSQFPVGAELAPQCASNASLIAAVPELLAALRAIIQEVGGPGEHLSNKSFCPVSLITAGHIAIARAEGK